MQIKHALTVSRTMEMPNDDINNIKDEYEIGER